MTHDPKDTIAFQGALGAHSDMACRAAYPYMHTLPCSSFEEVFQKVESGEAGLGFIPVENTRAGRVAEIHNLLPESNLHVVGEYWHKVEHHLLGAKGASIKTIEEAHSHPQALMQCRKTMDELCIKRVPHADTAQAAKDIAESGDTTRAALASTLAAELYGLEVVKDNVQDHENNRTLFLAISKEPVDPDPEKGMVLTSLIFTVRNIPSGLYKALGGFATNSVNLLKLESHLTDPHAGKASFYATLEGHPDEKHVQLALEELGFFTKRVKVLGVYPADKSRSS